MLTAARIQQLVSLAITGVVVGVLLASPAAPAAAQIPHPFPDDAVDPRASVNGCGSQGPDGFDAPEAPVLVSFTDACNWHDRCYGTKGLTKSYCDRGFNVRMQLSCVEALRVGGACQSAAYVYFLAVVAKGGEPYAEGQEAACARTPTAHGRTHGDPHLVTLDGLRYSLQVAGEFTLLEHANTGQDLIQARFHPVSDTFTVPSGVAVRVGDQVVSIQRSQATDEVAIYVDDVPVEAQPLMLLDRGYVQYGTELSGTNGVVTIRRDDGLRVDAVLHSSRLDLTFTHHQRSIPVRGLLGNADDDPDNDLTVGDTVYGATQVYEPAFVDAARVDPDESLFTAEPGAFDYHDPDLADYPIEQVTVEDFPENEVESARTSCSDAGLTDADLATCLFDVLVSGDDTYAQSAAKSEEFATRTADPARQRLVVDPPLVRAAASGDLDTVLQLLDSGTNPNVGRADDRATPIAFAAQNGHTDVVAALLDAGANPDLMVEGGLTALILAAQNGHTDVVPRLLEAGAFVDARSADGLTPLRQAAQNGHADIVRLLLESDADVDGIDPETPSPILLASQNGHVDAVAALAEAGAELDNVSTDGLHPLGVAASAGQLGVVAELLARGANPNANPDSPALVRASFSGDVEITRALLEAGADVDATDEQGFTGLIVAAQQGAEDTARALLEAGADPNRPADAGWRALHAAANRDEANIVGLLLDFGADPTLSDDRDALPADFTDDPEVLSLLGSGR